MHQAFGHNIVVGILQSEWKALEGFLITWFQKVDIAMTQWFQVLKKDSNPSQQEMKEVDLYSKGADLVPEDGGKCHFLVVLKVPDILTCNY